MIITRPQSPNVLPIVIPTEHQLGDLVIFVPGAGTGLIVQGVLAKIVGITFEETKVLYDIAIALNYLEFYDEYPFMRIDSTFILPKP